MEQLLMDAKKLVDRLREHDNSADTLIRDASALNFKLEAVKQLRDEVTELNEIAKHRARSTLILGSHEENARIRELQQENIEFQTSLAEYQSALELIMAKYRDQVSNLVKANKVDSECMKQLNDSKELQAKVEQINEMAAVMAKAISIDDQAIQDEQEKMVALEMENQGLRELLRISGLTQNDLETHTAEKKGHKGTRDPTSVSLSTKGSSTKFQSQNQVQNDGSSRPAISARCTIEDEGQSKVSVSVTSIGSSGSSSTIKDPDQGYGTDILTGSTDAITNHDQKKECIPTASTEDACSQNSDSQGEES
ncbi:FGFR1 oncogene partner 2 homolog isoform X2 [Nematostella vectensis]|uniref:FGFR1 oncogene partner 2 homolog isoform X2 n=1 Tax=Nematostella vectensis TaxID=45351 RepID=UPI002077456E|nr:FGFR1 oncogene partner 2 homolog isoform X2 [Nematostella vectensis]